jgi:ubiquinone/menaquinone biosynthesis C-methylase UbiE
MSSKQDIKRLYDSYSDVYGEVYKSKAGKYFMLKKLKCLHSLSQFKKEHKILEIGCADGCYTQAFEGYDITAIDLSQKNIATAKRHYCSKSIKFYVGDVEKLKFKDNGFDRVFSFSTLRYLDRLKIALSEIYRVTKPGGEVVLDFPNRYNPWFGLIKPAVTGKTHIHDHHYSAGQIKRYMKLAGFCDISIDIILFMPKNAGSNLFWLFAAFDKFMSIWPLKMLGAIIMVKGRKDAGRKTRDMHNC